MASVAVEVSPSVLHWLHVIARLAVAFDGQLDFQVCSGRSVRCSERVALIVHAVAAVPRFTACFGVRARSPLLRCDRDGSAHCSGRRSTGARCMCGAGACGVVVLSRAVQNSTLLQRVVHRPNAMSVMEAMEVALASAAAEAEARLPDAAAEVHDGDRSDDDDVEDAPLPAAPAAVAAEPRVVADGVAVDGGARAVAGDAHGGAAPAAAVERLNDWSLGELLRTCVGLLSCAVVVLLLFEFVPLRGMRTRALIRVPCVVSHRCQLRNLARCLSCGRGHSRARGASGPPAPRWR